MSRILFYVCDALGWICIESNRLIFIPSIYWLGGWFYQQGTKFGLASGELIPNPRLKEANEMGYGVSLYVRKNAAEAMDDRAGV
jgi:hypothetical protein